jgi:hypothetical protein
MPRIFAIILLSVAALLAADAASAAGYPWRSHAAPYDFPFGNEIDTHQQSRKAADGALAGFLYVHYTGETTTDGLPVAVHDDCAIVACDVGWTFDALPASATLLYHVEGDHPVWLIDRADIPQPGAYAHFHWSGAMPAIGADAQGYLLELFSVAHFCFLHHAMAGTGTCRERGGVAVAPGVDIATHVNIVASFPGP